jgi:hypothetical protein
MTPALQLEIPAPPQAPPAVRCIGPAAAEPAEPLLELAQGLARACGARARALVQALDGSPIFERPGLPPLAHALAGAGMPELDVVTRWHHAHAHLARFFDPELGRLADELVTLRSLVRDADHTARSLAPGGTPDHALMLAWLVDRSGELEAVVSYTDRSALSFARRGRVPYVYNVWSRAPGRGRDLLRFVAWQTHGRPITLHPLHEQLAAYYVRAYGARPAE